MKPILFAADMVRAILDNRKMVTRRVVKLKYGNTNLEMFTDKYGTRLVEMQNEEPGVTTIKNPDGTTTHKLLACIEKKPPYRPGDILYVREMWRRQPLKWSREDGYYDFVLQYRADFTDEENECYGRRGGVAPWKWHPSIHMPREAARIFLRVTDVRVERLKDMTADSAWDEGFTDWNDAVRVWNGTIKPADRALYGWDANPLVWVIEFERISREEAQRGN